MANIDYAKYRHSGELSDLKVIVDGREFNLHKFPLFVRSNYFKNLASSQGSNHSTVTLDKFPGGAHIFELIADYCYNKDVDVNYRNAIPVRCATEYLQMTSAGAAGNSQKSNLALTADSVIYDLTHSIKSKRDYYLPLNLINQAAKYELFAQKADLNTKLINSFADGLSYYTQTNSLYDGYHHHLHHGQPIAVSSPLNEEQSDIVNQLPLDWFLQFVKAASRAGLSQPILTNIIQNYIDYNTGLNPHYNDELKERIGRLNKSAPASDRPNELITMAADILKVEQKMSSLLDKPGAAESAKESNLIRMADDIMNKEKEEDNLVKIAGEILKKNDADADEVVEVDDDEIRFARADSNDSEAENKSNLISMAADILEKDRRPNNLINMAADILAVDKKSQLVGIMKEMVNPNDQDAKMARISAHIVNKAAAKDDEERDYEARYKVTPRLTHASDDEKLETIGAITKLLAENKIEPNFPVSWLLLYVNALHNLNADASVKTPFNRWTWNALHDLKSGEDQLNNLASIPPVVMLQMTSDAAPKDDHETQKLIKLIDRYMADAEEENKLSPEVFIKLMSATPKEKRASYDKPVKILLNLFKKGNHMISSDTQKELLDLIDFQKVSEATLEECKQSEFIPSQYIIEAALALCAKLRKELDDAKLRIKSLELNSRPYYTSASAAPIISTLPSYMSSSKYYTDTPYTPRYTSTSPVRNRSAEPKTDEQSIYRHITVAQAPAASTSTVGTTGSKPIYPLKVTHTTNHYPLVSPRIETYKSPRTTNHGGYGSASSVSRRADKSLFNNDTTDLFYPSKKNKIIIPTSNISSSYHSTGRNYDLESSFTQKSNSNGDNYDNYYSTTYSFSKIF